MLRLIKGKLEKNYIDKSNFTEKKIIRDGQGHYILIKESNFQEDTMTHKVYVLKNRVLKYVRPKILKVYKEIGESTITVGDFNTNQ